MRYVAKLAVAFVVEETIAFERGDVDVVAAVVIVIGDRNAHAIHLHIQAAAGGDIGERAVVIVAIERRQRFAAARRPVFAVDEQNVRPAIAIGIEERHAGSQGLRQIFLAGFPALCTKLMPACAVTSVNMTWFGAAGKECQSDGDERETPAPQTPNDRTLRQLR